jgi:alpha-beta hydrolase superfamily lysophospholipase
MRSGIRTLVARAAVVAVALSCACVVLPGAHPAARADEAGGGVDSFPVAFHVVASNRSGLPCAALPAGADHEVVRGHVTGPRSALDGHRGRGLAGTLYAHGDGYAEYFWRYPDNGKYNYVDHMARRGHVSVTIDRLGYGRSDKPNGNDICFGVEADVLHQIIGQLRRGSYSGDRTPRFERVGLVGHSAGGLIAEQEAAGFQDIDALGVLDSGELNATPLVLQRAAEQQARCLLAPDSLVGLLNPSSRHGYAPLEADGAQFRSDHMANVEPDIARDLIARRTDDACAGTRNAAQALAGNPVRNSLVTVPVLLLAGARDKLFPNPALQAATYPRSKRVTVRVVSDAGHAVAFARTAPIFQHDMDSWLDGAGL